MGYFSKPIDDLDLVDRVDGWRQTAMYTKNLVVDDNTQCQEIKHVCKVMPNVCVAVLASAFGVEAIGLCDASGLMIPPDKVNAMWVSQFQTDKQRNGLDAEKASINVVTWTGSAFGLMVWHYQRAPRKR